MTHVHFIGIGGSGLSAIARLLLESGYTVSGSDRTLTSFAEDVRKAGATALEQMAGVLDAETAEALVGLLPRRHDEESLQLLRHLIGAIPTAVMPLCSMLKHPDPEAQLTAAAMLDQLLDPRSVDAFIEAMGRPAVRAT